MSAPIANGAAIERPDSPLTTLGYGQKRGIGSQNYAGWTYSDPHSVRRRASNPSASRNPTCPSKHWRRSLSNESAQGWASRVRHMASGRQALTEPEGLVGLRRGPAEKGDGAESVCPERQKPAPEAKAWRRRMNRNVRIDLEDRP